MTHKKENDPGTPLVRGKILSGRVYPECFPLGPEDRVLNVGCGTGPQAVVYRRRFRFMAGIDINFDRLVRSGAVMAHHGIDNFKPVQGDVEALPFRKGSFDKALLVDIIEHVRNPGRLLHEVHSMLRPGGEMLVTFPAMHDRFVQGVSKIARFFGRARKGNILTPGEGWHPDAHGQHHSCREWIRLVTEEGFQLMSSRASTLFPPLHRYGVPRFWFSIDAVHAVDAFFCRQPVLKNWGQALVCIFRRAQAEGRP
jgi:SAM-dependent methyltransferase